MEADHDQVKSRLRPMRGLERLRSARGISAGNAVMQNLHRGHCEFGMDVDPRHRLPAAVAEVALTM
ncbi:MAG: transposase [Actinobacteria bacterium]|nr:transposase [Actinomycetota bacterium]